METRPIYSANQIAEYFLALVCGEEGDNLTNLKVQKLLYYAQGFNLALYKKPLFSEQVEAWRYGPVVSTIYHEYKEFGSQAIDCPTDFDYASYDEQTKQLLDEVYEVYGQYTASTLMRFTHEEAPWKNTEQSDEITHHELIEYFTTQLK